MTHTTDSCPRCLTRGIKPRVDAEDYDGNTHKVHCCSRCGHRWVTRRIAEPEESSYAECDDPDAWEADDDFSDYDRDRGWL